jgi:hypothetical protein
MLQNLIHGGRYEILFDLAIHKRSGDWHSPPYAGGTNLKRLRHSVWTWRWSIGPESISEHRCVAIAISAEVASVLAVVFRAYPLGEHPHPDLNL